MRRITTFLLCLFCVVTLTTPTVLAARMLPVFAVGDTAHCQTGVEHSDQHLTEAAQDTNPPVPLESDAGDCTDCSNCPMTLNFRLKHLHSPTHLPSAVHRAPGTAGLRPAARLLQISL
jgi:hypothetical protein